MNLNYFISQRGTSADKKLYNETGASFCDITFVKIKLHHKVANIIDNYYNIRIIIVADY